MARVVGLGPSGSAFLRAHGRAVGVERGRRYLKACGEAVPVETPMVDMRFVVDRVTRFVFLAGDRRIGEVAYRRPRWYMVEKGPWVEWLRSGDWGDGEDDGVLVRAGGPYQSRGLKITVARAYVEGLRAEDETAYFVFPRERPGFYWIFPHGPLHNVGAGFLGVENPVPLLLDFVRRLGGSVRDLRGAPLTVMPQVVLHDGEAYRIGEAAGLVYPLTGEGIRPGVLSAIALAGALRTRRPLDSYRRAVEGVVRQVEFQKRLLARAARALSRGLQLLELADDAVLRDYIEENLSARTLFALAARRPAVAVRLAKALVA